MTEAAYWFRTLAWFLVYGPQVKLTFIGRAGTHKSWTSQLVGVGRGGPLIEWQGGKYELCPWSKLIAIEDAREVHGSDQAVVAKRCR